jgi:hypothetical protein
VIHHVSIPARDVSHVAKVLSELTGWKARPFLGPVPGAIMLLAEDGNGTGVEIYPDGTIMSPREGDDQCRFGRDEAPTHFPFHFLLSLDTDRATVQRIGDREGWRTLNCWRGPPQHPVFELIEFWIENRVMIEIATPDMLPNYVRTATSGAHDEILARMPSPPTEGRVVHA